MTPNNFLGLPEPASTFERARVLVLPMPFEATVSYGHGTANGPAAILAASQQVELYDREFDAEPALVYGIHTLPVLGLPDDPAQAVEVIAAAVETAARTGKLVVGLGGEHTVSLGFGRGLLRVLGGPITVVQIDAHSDLRDRFDDTPFSHACVARRLLEEPGVEQILQLGIRSVDAEEVAFARQAPDRVRVWYTEDLQSGHWREEFIARVRGRLVFLTVDLDGLDPAIIPSTGTPEPDGLTWGQTMDLLRTITHHATVIGVDCVELAPVPGHHAADFAAAKLLYKTISYVQAQQLAPGKGARS